MQHWYVYYKVGVDERSHVIGQVRQMQGALSLSAGVQARLMERADSERQSTLMEVYEGIREPERFAMQLDAALHGARLPAAIVAGRRTERFTEARAA
jgi:hypothetical protein